MADKSKLEQMLAHLVNEDQAKAEELFHEYVVEKSREIYESMIDAELDEASEEDEDDEDVEEAAKDEDAEEDKVDEEFEDIAIEGDDEMGAMGGDPTDDLESELDAEMDDDEDMEDKDPAELFQDLDAIVDELQAKFDAMGGGDEGEEEMKDSFGMEDTDLETVREYVEKVPNAKMGDNGVNTKSIVAGKNDMGGTTANILSGRNGADAGTVGAGSKIKGSALNDQNPKEDNAGNINVPGGKAGGAFSKKEPGHGAEKKGQAEQADNKQSLFRGRR